MTTALALAVASALCFGSALVTGRVGLRTLDARAGAAISIPTATVLLILLAPFTIDLQAFNTGAAALFACVGLFFPAVVTILTFRSNEQLGPTVTSAVSGTAPLFALPAAAWFLQERIPSQAAVAGIAVAIGVALLVWRPGAEGARFPGWALLWPLSGALIRGVAQAIAKAGLLLWPNPFAAGLIGYVVSSATVVAASRYGRFEKPRLTRSNVAWFAITGVLNGTALVLMYTALGIAPVSLVAPVVAAYPLVTALVSALVLREERMTMQMAAGATITVCAIVYLVVG
jgi:drug/metabolite transporter (DMT)-like permease